MHFDLPILPDFPPRVIPCYHSPFFFSHCPTSNYSHSKETSEKEPSELPDKDLQVIKDYLRKGQKLTAIKFYRQKRGIGIKQAKEKTEIIENNLWRCSKIPKIDSDLLQACAYGEYGKVRELLIAGADGNVQDQDGWTPLRTAAQNGGISIIYLLTNPFFQLRWESFSFLLDEITKELSDREYAKELINSAKEEMPIVADIIEELSLLTFAESNQDEVSRTKRDLLIFLALSKLHN